MLTGMPPFYNKDREKLFNTIKTGQVKFPKYLSKEAVDLLEKFFIKDPENRLGSGPNGLQDIKSHPFFATINWESIINKNIKPPFIPKLRNENDTRYFDPDFTEDTSKDSYNAGDSLNENENPYVGFSYDANKEGEKEVSHM